MRQIVNKPSSADDPAWETVRDMTRIYYMQRQMDNQIYACRVDNTLNYYRYDFSKLADWRITDVMVEYATDEVCGYATYVGRDSEVAVPEKINIPVYGDVKVRRTEGVCQRQRHLYPAAELGQSGGDLRLQKSGIH